MKLLVTGGCGFIGSAFLRLLRRERPDWSLVNFDKLTYAGHPSTVAAIADDPHHQLVQGDIADAAAVESVFREGIDAVVHFAAESHVDRSIDAPAVFVRTNVLGTQVLLDAARRHGVHRFVQVSTDEVYGSLGADGRFTEDSPIQPSSPYSASKASGDLLALAWHHTFGLPASVTRCSNNLGPFQFPEKLIPVMVSRALRDQPLPVYGTGLNVRDWIHVDDHARAVLAVLEIGAPGRVYNIGADNERSNLDIVRAILALLGKPESLIQFISDRPGHDFRYAIDASRARAELGWSPRLAPAAALEDTVRWYVDNEPWVRMMESRTR